MWEIFLDALLDSLKLLPFVFVIYILIELVETRSVTKAKTVKLLGNKFAPLFGATIGVIPQCGFSVMATKLYQENYILVGTLMSVYIATSDEAIPILISDAVTNPSALSIMWQVLAVKVVFAIVVGFVVNFIFRKKRLNAAYSVQPCADEVNESVHHDDEDEHDHQHQDESDESVVGCCHHEIGAKMNFWQFIKHPIKHSVMIFLYVFAVNLVFGTVINLWIGIDALTEFMSQASFFQPFVVALIGLIPNCASSVVITQLLLKGTITVGAGIAGLSVNSGIALAVLFADKSKLKSNLALVACLYLLCSLLGLAVTLLF